ncbi:hypothetical protein L2E82_32473 [Cichorium intybus]|uniref:Uncharacterized protein n=1 Tax=Cichorium intybus TaxID=13427 RepID=A0ACB9BGX0_CICIN|nr:hypothetical protein L2E82_32473 [Cichorium intybus]
MVVLNPNPSSTHGSCSFVIQLLKGRWFMIFVSFLIMAGAGATYLFGVYSKEIKNTLGYDQSTLNLLGSAKDLGAAVGVFSGLLAEVTPTWFVLLVGSLMNFTGYFMIWLAVTKKIAKPSVWQMCAYICIGANSQNFANTGSLVTCVKNFPSSRGRMLGTMKGFVGLSGAIFTQLYLAIYGNDAKSLILFIGWLPTLISIVCMFIIRPRKSSRHPNEVKIFYEYLGITIVLALVLMTLTIVQKYVNFSHNAYVACATSVCVLLLSPFAIAIREELNTWKMSKKELETKQTIDDPPIRVPVEEPQIVRKPVCEIEEVPESPKDEPQPKKVSCWANICNKPKRGEDYSILQALLSIDMLILFIATFCGFGSSLTAVDNLGQIGESLEFILEKWKIPRTLMMTLVLLLPCIGDLFIAFPFPGSVYIASLLIGFSYGAQMMLLFIIISELFGLKYYSTLFNCGQLASPIGSYIFNVKIVGKLYDNEALKQLAEKGMTRSMAHELTCIGRECYRVSFVVLACVNLFGALVSLVLVMRTRGFYKGDIYRTFKMEMEANEKEMAVVSGVHN